MFNIESIVFTKHTFSQTISLGNTISLEIFVKNHQRFKLTCETFDPIFIQYNPFKSLAFRETFGKLSCLPLDLRKYVETPLGNIRKGFGFKLHLNGGKNLRDIRCFAVSGQGLQIFVGLFGR